MNYNLTAKIQVKKLYGRVNRSSASEIKIALQDMTVTPTMEEQAIEASSEYDGLGTVTVVGDENFIAKNIKTGVTVWGVEGTFAGGSPFSAKADGCIPYYEHGFATSIMGAFTLTSSAS